MADLSDFLNFLYEEKRLLYAVTCVVAVGVVGTVFGLAMDWLGRRLGVDTSTLSHHREKVQR